MHGPSGRSITNNLLKAELEDERRLVLEDKYRLGSLSKDLFEDFNIVADKATSTNSLESMLDLIEQSLDTDPEYRESVSHQTGITDGTSYMRLVPQDNPEGMLPPTPWGRKAAEEGSAGIPPHPAGRSTAGSGHRPGYGSGGPERSGTRIMSACTTIGSRHAAYDGRELREFWTRAKRRMGRQDFEKLRPPSAIRQ